MKTMFTLIMSTMLILSCQKETPIVKLSGTWQLIKTELYEDTVLSGSNSFDTDYTTYHFNHCANEDESCELIIEEDGVKKAYHYTYDSAKQLLTINQINQYTIERLTENDLIFNISQDVYTSRYVFSKRR